MRALSQGRGFSEICPAMNCADQSGLSFPPRERGTGRPASVWHWVQRRAVVVRIANSAAEGLRDGVGSEDDRNAWRSARSVTVNEKRGAVVVLVERQARGGASPKTLANGGALN